MGSVSVCIVTVGVQSTEANGSEEVKSISGGSFMYVWPPHRRGNGSQKCIEYG